MCEINNQVDDAAEYKDFVERAAGVIPPYESPRRKVRNTL